MTRERDCIDAREVVAAGCRDRRLGAPSWLALILGFAIAPGLQQSRTAGVGTMTIWTLQLGNLALGAGMEHRGSWSRSASGPRVTAKGLADRDRAGHMPAKLMGFNSGDKEEVDRGRTSV